MEILKIFILFLAGLCGAAYASTVGGMGLVTFTAMIIFGLPIPVAIGTNRFIALFMDISSAIRLNQYNKIPVRPALGIGLVIAIGSFFGASMVNLVPKEYLRVMAIIVLCGAFLLTFVSKKLGKRKYKFKRIHLLAIIPLLLVLGIYGGIIGIAFGTLIIFVPLYLGYDMGTSAGVARVVGIMMALSALYVFITQGLVDYAYALPMVLGAICGSWIGVAACVKKGDGFIKALLSIIILTSIISLLFS